jgi:phage gp29-like protein
VGFGGLVRGLMSAVLPGYAVAEIVWTDGGAAIQGFHVVPAHHFTFRDGAHPRLVTPETPTGVELPPGKFIVFRYSLRPGDVVRSGLIRPLAWLYAFKNLNLKDLLRYVEKFGMPFLIARLDDYAFDQERLRIAAMIRHFASDGGGVFTKSADLELLQPSGSSGEVYFRFLDYCERAISKILLGQTSTSDSRDANRSTAQIHNLVRLDLRTDDCGAMAETIERQLLRPLVHYNYGPTAPIPRFCFRCSAETDRERESRILLNLRQAGYDVAPEAVEAAFGYSLRPAHPAAAD